MAAVLGNCRPLDLKQGNYVTPVAKMAADHFDKFDYISCGLELYRSYGDRIHVQQQG